MGYTVGVGIKQDTITGGKMELDIVALRMYMAERGYTQTELAHRIDLHVNTVSDMLNARSQPGLETLGKLCIEFDCTPNDLLVLPVRVE